MEKNIEKNIKKSDKINFGLTGNELKLIAVICMIIDHIGYFFANKISYEMYVMCRGIGRIAMPIFVFLLVEGFFHTKNLKKYVLRIFGIAVITQIVIFNLNYINTNYFYSKIKNISMLNILFSFFLILLILRLIDKNILNKKINCKFKNIKIIDAILRITGIIAIFSIYFILEIDYGIYLSVMAIVMYWLKKYENSIDKSLKNFLLILTVVIFSVIAVKRIIGIFSLVASFGLLIYNGKRGKDSKLVSSIYYSVFPLQYFVIYLLALLFI